MTNGTVFVAGVSLLAILSLVHRYHHSKSKYTPKEETSEKDK